jgi:effector-binding domain-containing protein
MKKFIRFMVVLLLIIIAAIVALMFTEPQDITVVRTTLIKAPKEAAFDQIVHFTNWPNWDPWSRLDSGKMKRTLYGTDGTPGSGYTWVGDKTGAGDMRDSAIDGTSLLYRLAITQPYASNAWGYLKAADTAGMTKVTWTCTMHFGRPMNAMLIFMNMDKMLGPDFENGLNNMKNYLESKVPAAPVAAAIEVTEVDYPGHTFAGLRKTISMASMGDMMKLFDDAKAVMTKNAADKIKGPSAGIYFTWDTLKKETDMAAVFPVSDVKTIKDATIIDIPASRAVMAVLHGGYGKEMEVHSAIAKHIAEKGETKGTVVEEYTIGRDTEPDSNKWVTNIYYLIK